MYAKSCTTLSRFILTPRTGVGQVNSRTIFCAASSKIITWEQNWCENYQVGAKSQHFLTFPTLSGLLAWHNCIESNQGKTDKTKWNLKVSLSWHRPCCRQTLASCRRRPWRPGWSGRASRQPAGCPPGIVVKELQVWQNVGTFWVQKNAKYFCHLVLGVVCLLSDWLQVEDSETILRDRMWELFLFIIFSASLSHES